MGGAASTPVKSPVPAGARGPRPEESAAAAGQTPMTAASASAVTGTLMAEDNCDNDERYHIDAGICSLEHMLAVPGWCNAASDTKEGDTLTPLHVYAAKGRHAVVRRLLAAGADVWIETASGHTALDLARAGNHAETVRVLEAAQQHAPRFPPWGCDPLSAPQIVAHDGPASSTPPSGTPDFVQSSDVGQGDAVAHQEGTNVLVWAFVPDVKPGTGANDPISKQLFPAAAPTPSRPTYADEGSAKEEDNGNSDSGNDSSRGAVPSDVVTQLQSSRHRHVYAGTWCAALGVVVAVRRNRTVDVLNRQGSFFVGVRHDLVQPEAKISSALCRASKTGQLDAVQSLLQIWPLKDQRRLLLTEDEFQRHCLYYTCLTGQVPLLSFFLDILGGTQLIRESDLLAMRTNALNADVRSVLARYSTGTPGLSRQSSKTSRGGGSRRKQVSSADTSSDGGGSAAVDDDTTLGASADFATSMFVEDGEEC